MANAQLQVKFTTNILGTQNLVHNGFKFQAKNRREDRVYWKCSTSTCTATINTHNNLPTKVVDYHNHPADHMTLKVDDVLQQMKTRCRNELTPVPAIYEDELVKLRNTERNEETKLLVEHIPTLESCKGERYNERHMMLPPLPTTTADFNINVVWAQTTIGEPFLLADDDTNGRILIFTAHKILTHLATADTIYGYGTFYSCASLFYQLYTFYAIVDCNMYPLVYSLLPAKSQTVCTKLLTLLKDLCQQHQLQLLPRSIFLDYEVAIRYAAYTVFPGINAKGCFFHYTQCIWRKVQDTSLQVSNKENNDINKLVCRAAVLPLLPVNDLEDVWFHALEDLEEADTNTPTLAFIDYITSYWVESNRHLWNHYQTGDPRTTNHLEGWHSKLKKHLHYPHPNIFNLIKLLKHEEAINDMKMIQYAAGGKRVPNNREYREIDHRLTKLKQRLHK